MEQLPLVVYVDAVDSVSSNIFTSRQIEPLLGYSVEEWATDAELFTRLLHPDDRERVLAAHAQHATRRTSRSASSTGSIARDGRVVHLRDEGVIVLDEDGRAALPAGLPPRHHARAGGGAAAAAARPLRPADRPGEPRLLPRAAQARDQAPARGGARDRAALHRPRRLQGDQRPLGTRPRRRGAARDRHSASSARSAPATRPPASAATSSPSS